MKKLLLILGDLATGKSTFSQILSERYDTIAFTKDSFKETLGDTIGFTNREENLKLSKASVELMQLAFSEFAKRNKNLILEANFHTEELEKLYEMADAHQYDVLVLVLRGDLHILHKRYLNRIHHENRHPVHLSTPCNNFEDFVEYIEAARKEKIEGNIISIQADDFSYQQDEKLLQKIDTFMGFKE